MSNLNRREISEESQRIRRSKFPYKRGLLDSLIYKNSYDGILVIDSRRQICYANPSFLALYGIADLNLIKGKPLFEIFTPDYRDTAESMLDLFNMTGENTQAIEVYIYDHANKAIPVFFWFAGPVNSEHTKNFVYIRDITNWKHAQEELTQANFELGDAYRDTLEGWGMALEMRDQETEGHTKRVTDWTVQMAMKMDMSVEKLTNMRYGAMLHDIGKMGIPDSILLKPGPLDDNEWQVMKMHPIYAKDWLISVKFLKSAITIPYYHHEKWNGTGYPEGLAGKTIPVEARIFCIIDVWDALLSDRPYRKGWPKARVVDYILANKGSHFDPELVDIFLDLQNENARKGPWLQ